jgi:putative FmdB family regulatory protein
VPIYDYVCASCRHRIEVIHGINDAGPRFCPSCGAEATMHKALTSPTVHFKGSGWAKKDRSSTSASRSGSGTGGSSTDGSTAGDGATSGEGAGSGDGASAGKSAAGDGADATGKTTAGTEPAKSATDVKSGKGD